MKTFYINILFLIASIFIISCSKDKDVTPISNAPTTIFPEQNPLPGFLNASGFSQVTTNTVNSSYYEFGYSFIPLVNGKITALVIKIPDAHLGMRVTFWNKTTRSTLRTQILNVPTANVEVIQVISLLELVKNNEYMITFNSNDWYTHKKTDGSSCTYPFTVDDIKITGYSYKLGTAQEIPTNAPSTLYEGDCSFKFQQY